MNKKGQAINGAIYTLIFLAIGLVVVGFVLSFGAKFVSDQQATFTASSYAYNATGQSLSALNDLSKQQGTVSSVGILVIVVGMLLGVVALFGYLRGRQGTQ